MKYKHIIKIGFIFFLVFYSCKIEKQEIIQKEKLNLIYIILDKSSNSFSALGGREENYINIDTTYVNNLLDKLFENNKKNKNKSSIIVFFNYIDKNANGNKELFFKIPSISIIDTIYKPKSGQIVSSKKSFYDNVKIKKIEIEQQIVSFKIKKQKILIQIEEMLLKSKKTNGSDCSGTLLVADKKLNNYYIDTTKYKLNKKLIVAYSDLVNYPSNNTKIDLKNLVIRPGYTSEVKYLNNNQLINKTTQEEFIEFISNYLNN